MKTAIIDSRVPPSAERELMKRGFSVIRAVPSSRLPAPLSSHPDMLTCLIGSTLISSADYVEEAPAFFDDLACATHLNFEITADEFKTDYPFDCIFNALVIGDKIFCKTDSVGRGVIRTAERIGKKIVNTNQGYPACTVLALDEGHAITADLGMARILEKEGIDVCLIENGDISLPPYEYGFIGGAAGVADEVVYFLGNPSKHRDGQKILDYIAAVGLRTIALIDAPLADFGKIIFCE